MKKSALFVLAAIGLMPLAAQSQVRETPATIFLVQGGNPQGFIQGSNAQGVVFSPVQGQQGKTFPFSSIKGDGLNKGVRLSARSEVLANARAMFAEGKFREAAAEYGKVSDAFSALILGIPQNFATEARYFQLESLRRAGAFSAMPALLETPAAKTITTHLPESFQRPHTFQKLWALYGAKDMAGLKAALERYQKPQMGQEKLLPTPNTTDMTLYETAQIAFLRAKVYDSEGEKEKALQDYYRVFSLTSGNDPFLTKQAMGAAMVIQKNNPGLQNETNKIPLLQMQSLAYIFSKQFGADSMPAAFKEFAVRPELPKPPKAEEKPEETAAEGEAKPAEGEDAKPAEEEKPAE